MEFNTDENIIPMIIDARSRYKYEFFMEILIIGCWSIWNHINGMIFDNIPANINACRQAFKMTFHDTMIRAKPSILGTRCSTKGFVLADPGTGRRRGAAWPPWPTAASWAWT